MEITYKSWKCEVVFATYPNGRTAIQLVDAEDGSPVATATVNVPDAVLGEDEILVKNWSENQGMLAALVAAGLVEDTGKVVPTGFVKANVVRLISRS